MAKMQLMRLQLASIVLVISALATAEYAAMALAARPGSTLLWWLNLEVFRGINTTQVLVDAAYPLDHRTATGALAALLGLALAAYRWKVRLGLALLSNLAFFYCGALAYVLLTPYAGAPVATASLASAPVAFDSGWALAFYLLLGSLAGAVASHIAYFHRMTGRRSS